MILCQYSIYFTRPLCIYMAYVIIKRQEPFLTGFWNWNHIIAKRGGIYVFPICLKEIMNLRKKLPGSFMIFREEKDMVQVTSFYVWLRQEKKKKPRNYI